MDILGGSATASPCSSYQPSPTSSTFASPASSSYLTNANIPNGTADPDFLIPWLKNLSSASSSASSKAAHNHPNLHHLYIHGGSISAPVTPPLSSPTARTPRIKTDWDESTGQPSWAANHAYQPSSTPPSPGRQVGPESGWLSCLQLQTGGSSSPTFSLVSTNPFGFLKEEALVGGGSFRMWMPGQSGTCSPAVAEVPTQVDVHMSDEFAFGSGSNGNTPMTGMVKAWEGEKIHEECASDDLELTLGSSRTRSDAC